MELTPQSELRLKLLPGNREVLSNIERVPPLDHAREDLHQSTLKSRRRCLSSDSISSWTQVESQLRKNCKTHRRRKGYLSRTSCTTGSVQYWEASEVSPSLKKRKRMPLMALSNLHMKSRKSKKEESRVQIEGNPEWAQRGRTTDQSTAGSIHLLRSQIKNTLRRFLSKKIHEPRRWHLQATPLNPKQQSKICFKPSSQVRLKIWPTRALGAWIASNRPAVKIWGRKSQWFYR